MSIAMQFELEDIRDKLVRGDAESIEIALMVVERLLNTIDSKPEEHLRKIRRDLADLDDALGHLDDKVIGDSSPDEGFYRIPKARWQRILSLRDNAVALSRALAAGQRTFPCGRCHRWVPIPEDDLREDGNGHVGMRCICGYEWSLEVMTLGGDLRGVDALKILPKSR